MIIGDAKDVLGAAGARADEVIVGTGSSAVTVWESFTWHVLSPGAGEAQDQIASIVRSHGDDPESVTSFRNYGFDFANMTNSYRAFYVFSYLESVNLRNTQNLTITDGMFYGCSNLVEIPPMDWSKVTSSSGAFGFCGSLSSVILNGMKSSFLVSNTSMSAAALNALFESLGTAAREQQVNAASTPGAGSANTGILHGKNWIARTGGLAFTDTFNRGNGTPGSGYSYAGLRPDIWDNRVGGGYNSGAMKAGTMTLSGQSITTNRYR
ncbi:MAG: leucine-rich repeat domain-containing protein, partial [Nocardioidaceae bacterium]|nr:leucine-rich repeat domain-containing protein [Nocardioidaceae bacterium]